MSILKTIAETAAEIAEGAVLAAAVYLVNRGAKHPIKRGKK